MNSKQFKGILSPDPTPPPLEVNSQIKFGNSPPIVEPPPVGKVSVVLAVLFYFEGSPKLVVFEQISQFI